MKLQILAIGLLPIMLVACSSEKSLPKASGSSTPEAVTSTAVAASPATEKPPAAKPLKRWYAFQHVNQGSKVYQENCAACHGKLGEGGPDWKKVGPDGKYPAPPLNGTGHAWHHPLKMLFHVVKNGSPGGQGNMPAWKDKLSDDEMTAAIAWFQSKWPDEIYNAWMQREMASLSKKNG